MKRRLSLGSTDAQMTFNETRNANHTGVLTCTVGMAGPRQGSKTKRKTVCRNYNDTLAANRVCKVYKAKWFQTFLPRLNWAVWENKLESHIGCMRADTKQKQTMHGRHDRQTEWLTYTPTFAKNLITMLQCRSPLAPWTHKSTWRAFALLSDF